MISRNFDEFWRELPESLRKFNIEEMLGSRGTMLTRLLLPVGIKDDKLKKAWRVWREKFDDHKEWIRRLDAFCKKSGRVPDIESTDLEERELAAWVEKQRKRTEIRRENAKLKSNK
jgi:hypothetical protein